MLKWILCLFGLVIPTSHLFAHHRSFSEKDQKAKHYSFSKRHHRQSTGKSYMGREIAEVMGPAGIPWLERPTRLHEEHLSQLITNMKLSPNSVVADIGAGSGRISQMIAEQLGQKGKVYAVEIQDKMIAAIKKRMEESKQKLAIVPIKGTITTVPIKARTVDMALLVDVYHEFSHPREMIQSIVKSLKPGGHLILVEYRAEDPKVPIKRLHKMSMKQIQKEINQTLYPLTLYRHLKNLPRQHMVVFKKHR